MTDIQPQADSAQVDEKWRAYPNTILEFASNPPLRLDLRAPLTDEARSALSAAGLGSPFGVFTAENPAGDNAEDQNTSQEEQRQERVNDRRESRLERELRERGAPFLRVDGVSPDGEYREHCVATLVSRADAVALARRYEQLALFWYDGSAFWLLPALARKDAMRLPVGARNG